MFTARNMSKLLLRSRAVSSSRPRLPSSLSLDMNIVGVRYNSSIKDTVARNTWSFSDIFSSFNARCTSDGKDIDPMAVLSPVASNVDPTLTEIVANVPDVVVPALGNNPTHFIMYFIDYLHTFAGIPYWEAIIGTTFVLRVLLAPITIKTMINGARMTALRPDMHKVQEQFKNDPNNQELSVRQRYQQEMQAMFKKHGVNPFRALMMPFIQLPIFIAFYTALGNMATYYPGLKEGGAFWFTNLSSPDPFYIFPVINGIAFLVMIEIGADGMPQHDPAQKQLLKNVFRFMGLLVVPLTASMPESVFMYWTTNSAFSIAQTLIIQKTGLKKWLGIPDAPPVELPKFDFAKIIQQTTEARKVNMASLIQNAKDGDLPPPPPAKGSASSKPVITDLPPTFSSHPNRKKKASK